MFGHENVKTKTLTLSSFKASSDIADSSRMVGRVGTTDSERRRELNALFLEASAEARLWLASGL